MNHQDTDAGKLDPLEAKLLEQFRLMNQEGRELTLALNSVTIQYYPARPTLRLVHPAS